MYCPLCGAKMRILAENEKEQFKDFEEADLYGCTGKECFGPGFPLIFHGVWGNHQNVKSFDTYPGDSWSLSWIK